MIRHDFTLENKEDFALVLADNLDYINPLKAKKAIRNLISHVKTKMGRPQDEKMRGKKYKRKHRRN